MSKKPRYPSGARFWREERCRHHRVFGGFPCPWRGCEHGVSADVIYEERPGPITADEIEFQRVEWPFDGESGFSWTMRDAPALLDAAHVAGSEAVRRIPALARRVERLYHYTDVHGLMGILREGGLWLSDAHYMNDRREIDHGADIAAEALQAALDNSQFGATAEHLSATLERLRGSARPRVCVASLCEEGDNLSQWRAYGAGGSRIALGFDPLGGRFRGLSHCHLRRVSYDRQVQLTWIRMLVQFHHVALEHDRVSPPSRGLPYVEEHFSEMLCNSLYELAVCFKDAAFVDEREWRFVYSETWPADMVDMLRAETRYRVRGRLIVPYVAMADLVAHTHDEPLPLREVIIGPQAEAELVARGVRDFLKSASYGDVPVRLSQTPFRPDL